MKNTTIISKTIKYIFSLILSLALTLSMIATAADADGFINASYNAQKRAVTVTSSGVLPGGEAAIVHVATYGTVLGEGSLPAVSDMLISMPDGSLGSDILLPEDFGNGKYTVYVTYASMTEAYKTDLLIFSEDSTDTDNAFKAVKGTSQKADFKTAVENGGFDLGIDVLEEIDFDTITDVMYGVYKNSEEYTFDVFSKSIDYGRMAVMIKNGESVDAAMKKYATVFNTSYADYSALSSGIKSELGTLITNSDFYNGFVDYNGLVAVATLRSSDGYGSVREYILDNADIFGIDTDGDYDSLSVNDKSKIFKDIYENRADLKTAEDVKRAFDNAVSDIIYYNSQSSASGSSSSSGKGSGSSGGGSSSFSEPAVSVPPTQNAVVTPPVIAEIYSDISGHFAKDYIETLSSNGVLSGFEDGSFRPDNFVTRAQVAKIITLAFGIDTNGDTSFDDVEDTSWYNLYVSSLASKGIVKGADNKFRPDDFITREDAAVVIMRALSYAGKDYSGEYSFNDSVQISDYALDAVNALAANGFLKGDGVSFMPKNSITRGELAAIIGRLTSINK